MKKILYIIIFMQVLSSSAQNGDDAGRSFVNRTFWSNRVANQQSVETAEKGQLVFRIGHRMGRLSSGAYQLFGLDESTFRLSFDYAVSDRLMFSLARSTVQKLYDGSVKYRLLRQTENDEMPVSVTFFSGMGVNSLKTGIYYPRQYFSSRLSYTFQLIAARKFNEWFSFQLAPAMVHRNLTETSSDHNDVFIAGAGATFKIKGRVAINLEYNYILPGQIYSGFNGQKVRNSATLGVDIYTGRHVFQIFLTNSTAMADQQFLTETTENWLDDGIRIGFNIERVFRLHQ